MKKLFILLTAFLLMHVITFAQSPQKMSYQAVIRNNSNQLVTNHAVGIQISILKGSEAGTTVFKERHTPTTNINTSQLLSVTRYQSPDNNSQSPVTSYQPQASSIQYLISNFSLCKHNPIRLNHTSVIALHKCSSCFLLSLCYGYFYLGTAGCC